MASHQGKNIIGLWLVGLLLVGCVKQAQRLTPPPSNFDREDTLVIWWERGFYAQEDEALEAVIDSWQAKTGMKVRLSLLDQETVLKKAVNALRSGNVPDIVFSPEAERTLVPLWARNGVLADVSDVIEPQRSQYSSVALQSAELYNHNTRDRSIYAVPLKQQTIHIHYWRDLLVEAGLSEADIPTDWDAFWAFWKQAQDNLHAKGYTEVHGVGLGMSREANDTYAAFNQVLEAYDIELLDEQGNLIEDNPQRLEKVAIALEWYTNFYKSGYVPSTATDWSDSDNNVAFLNRRLVMVVNPTLSIPASQREEDEDLYFKHIATIPFPQEPDGESPTYVVSMPQIVVFEAAPHQEMAKDFLSHLIQPENLEPYLERSLGRFFPVMPDLSAKPFWNDPSDPHISLGTQQFQSKTRPGYHALNPAYSNVQAENIWGQAIESILVDGVSPEEAAATALSNIEKILADWDK